VKRWGGVGQVIYLRRINTIVPNEGSNLLSMRLTSQGGETIFWVVGGGGGGGGVRKIKKERSVPLCPSMTTSVKWGTNLREAT